MAKRTNSPSTTEQGSKQGSQPYRINELIRVPQVRLVGENMEEISKAAGEEIKAGEVYNTRDVRDWAEKLALDVVEISPNAAPPVVRIIYLNKII